MYDHDPLTEDQILTSLAEALQAQREVPGELVDAGKAVFTLATMDAELAALERAYLSYDSLIDDLALQGSEQGLVGATRSEPATLRALTYSGREISIELEVTSDALLGQLVPPQPATVTVTAADGGSSETTVDDVGWFTVRPLPEGRFRLTVQTHDGRHIATGWIVL